MNKCFKYFKGMTGSVEILKDGNIHKCYFEIPLVCKFITDNIRQHIIYKANRNSDQERIK